MSCVCGGPWARTPPFLPWGTRCCYLWLTSWCSLPVQVARSVSSQRRHSPGPSLLTRGNPAVSDWQAVAGQRFSAIRLPTTCSSHFSRSSCRRSSNAKKPNRDRCGGQHDDRADKKHRAESSSSGEETQRRVGDSEREIEERGEGAHGESLRFGRSKTHRFDTEAGINQ